MIIWYVSHEKDELFLGSSMTRANGESQLEFSVSIKEDKSLPNVSLRKPNQQINAE
jgi:hypothetical protein